MLVVLRIVDGRSESSDSETSSTEFRVSRSVFCVTGGLRLFTGFRNTVTVPFLSSGGSVWVTMTAEAVVWITDLLMNGQQRILSDYLFTGHRGLVWKRP